MLQSEREKDDEQESYLWIMKTPKRRILSLVFLVFARMATAEGNQTFPPR